VSVALLSKKRECVRSVPIAAGYLASSRVQTFRDTKFYEVFANRYNTVRK
jgi:hypothetical protein